MKTVYPVIFTQAAEGVLVEVPDLEIFTEGKEMADAIEMARDAIGLKGISMEDAGEALPKPSPVAAVDPKKGAFAQDGAGIVSMVDIDFTAYRRRANNKMVRRNVTLPAWMDQEAAQAKINVSKCLQNALLQELQGNPM